MSLRRIILEMGTGNDLYGEDYTKAAVRAVQDALHHSSLTLFRTLCLDHDAMVVEVTIGVQKPERIDVGEVARQVPYGAVTVKPVTGGLDLHDPDNDTISVVATAAVAASLELPEGRYILPSGF